MVYRHGIHFFKWNINFNIFHVKIIKIILCKDFFLSQPGNPTSGVRGTVGFESGLVNCESTTFTRSHVLPYVKIIKILQKLSSKKVIKFPVVHS